MANKKGKKKGVVALIIFTILCLLVMGGGVAFMLIDDTLSWSYVVGGQTITVRHALKVDVLDALVFNNSELAFLLYVGIAIYAFCLLFLIAFIVSLIRKKKRLLIPAVIGTIAGEAGIAFFLLYNEFVVLESQAGSIAEAFKFLFIPAADGLHNWLFLALAGVLALLGLITLLIEIFCPASWAKKKAAEEEAEPEAEEKAEEEAKPEEEKVEEKPEEKEEEKPVEEKKLCPDCGEAVTDEMKECPSCGRKLKEEPAPAPIIVNVTTPEDKDSVSHDEMNRAIEEALAKDRAERKAAEEEAAKKKAEEEAARKAEEEEAARKAEEEEKKKAEEEAARKAAEEEAARKKTIKETQLREMVREEIRRKKEAEKAEKERAAAERKAKAEEERKAKAEADRKAKEEAARKAAEEEAARALAEARAAAEEARKAAEEARKAAAAPAVVAAPEVKEAKTPGKYEVYPEAGFYKYRLKANNGEILIVSNSYKTKISAHAGIATLQRNVQGGTYKIITDKSGYSQFRIFTGNDARLIVAGEFYPTPAGAESAYQSVLKFYLTERIVDLDEIPENEVREWRVQFEDVEELDTGRVEVFMEDNKFRARLLASNSELLFLTATYASKAGVLSAIDKIKEKFASGRDVTIVKDKQQRYQFIVYANNGAILIMGESYDAKTKAESAAHSVKRFLGKAAIVDQTKA